jgi:hypothetical protein
MIAPASARAASARAAQATRARLRALFACLKLACVAIYAAAGAAWAGALQMPLSGALQVFALVLLSLHLLELPFVFTRLRRYRGPLAVSVLLTVLFGLLHWLPLMQPAGERP